MYEEEPLFLLSDTYVKDFSYLIFFQWSGSREDIWPTLQPILHWEEEEESSSLSSSPNSVVVVVYQNFNIPFWEELFRKRTLSFFCARKDGRSTLLIKRSDDGFLNQSTGGTCLSTYTYVYSTKKNLECMESQEMRRRTLFTKAI